MIIKTASNIIKPLFSVPLIIVLLSATLVYSEESYANGVCLNCPVISKVFTSTPIGPGSVSTAVITIDNSAQALPATDLSFSDTLPAAISIATPANASTTCTDQGSATLSAPDGGSTISISDYSVPALGTCTVSVDVTSSTEGAHTNPVIDLSSSAGISHSIAVDLTVDLDRPGFSKSFSPSSVPVGDRSTLTFTIDNTLHASNVTRVIFVDNLPTGMQLANPTNFSTTCNSSTPPVVSADPGTNLIEVDFQEFLSGVVAAGAICTISIDVVATGVGDLVNVSDELMFTDTIGFFTTPAGKASASLESTVTPLAIQKSFVDDPTPPGGTVKLNITVDNFDRIDSATAVSFTDNLAGVFTGLTFNSLISNDCGGSVIGLGTTTIGLSAGTLAPESSCTIMAELAVPVATTPGAYTNTTGAVSGFVGGSPVLGNMASDTLFVSPVPSITKTFNDNPVNPGDTTVLEFTVTNTSLTSGATSVAFTDDFASILKTASVNPPAECCGDGSSCTFTPFFDPGSDSTPVPARLTVFGGTLAPAGMAGDSCTFSLTLDVVPDAAPGLYPNTTSPVSAMVDGATRTGVPATDTLSVIAAPTLSKVFLDDPVVPGSTVNLEFTLTYPPDASGDATAISFTDDLTFLTDLTVAMLPVAGEACDPDGPGGEPATGTLSESAGGTLLTFMDGTLSPGESCTFSVTLDVPADAPPGAHTNTTSGVSATVDHVPATAPPAVDDLDIATLRFTKEFIDDPVIAGDTTVLRFTLENVSLNPGDDATSISFNDPLSDVLPGSGGNDLQLSLPALVDTCNGVLVDLGGGTPFYAGGSLDVGSTCTVDLEVTVPAGTADGMYVNTTSSLTAIVDGSVVVQDGARDTLEVNSTRLQLSKTFSGDPANPGDTVTLTFELTNLDATNMASAIGFTDDLAAALPDLMFDSVNSNTCDGTLSGDGTTMLSLSGASLAASASCTIEISVLVPLAATSGTYTNTTSEVTGTIDMLAVTGTAASDDLEVLQLLDFSKSFDGATVANGTAILTFTLTNPGSEEANNLAFTDDLDAVLAGLEAITLPAEPCGEGSSIGGTSLLTFNGGSLAASGGMCSFDVEVQVPAHVTAGTYPNTTSDLTSFGLKRSDPATADLIIEPAPDFSKVFTPDMIDTSGMISTLTFTIDNSASGLAANDLDFTDNLPAAITVATPSNASTTCTGGTLTAVDGTAVISYTGGSVAAGATCTISVDTTATVIGMHVNLTGDLTSSSGNSGTATDTLEVALVDSDHDMIPDNLDNCPHDPNTDQADLDGDMVGDVCDPDIDGDMVDNGVDNCPVNANADQADLDLDGAGDVCDPDIDGDSLPNDYETQNGLDPFNSFDQLADPDGDGFTNLEEFGFGTDPNVADPDVDGNGVPDSVDERRSRSFIIPTIILELIYGEVHP